MHCTGIINLQFDSALFISKAHELQNDLVMNYDGPLLRADADKANVRLSTTAIDQKVLSQDSQKVWYSVT